MPNFHPILFKLCAYVNYMLVYIMHRERKIPMTITNWQHFSSNFESPIVCDANKYFYVKQTTKDVWVVILARPLGPKEIDGLLVPPMVLGLAGTLVVQQSSPRAQPAPLQG